MESPSQNQTGSYARYRLLSSLGGKVADALGVVIAIKTLSAVDYGVIGTALGLMAVVGFFNLTPEDILWRDLPKLKENLPEHLTAYVCFWIMKLVVVTVVAAACCAGYGLSGKTWQVAGAVFAIAVSLQVLSASALVEVPLFASLRPQRGAMFILGVRVLWLALLLPNLRLHSLGYYIVALGVYALTTALLSAWILRRQLGVHFRFDVSESWGKVRAAALDFTLWQHLVGRSRIFLQRGDLAILSALGVSLAALGQYTVAVNLAGFALIVPAVLENVAAVSFAHHPERRRENLRKFYAAAVALSAFQLGGGLLFGRLALEHLRVQDLDATFGVFIILLVGVSWFTVQSPALAYALCFCRMRNLFARVFLPACLVFVAAVWFAARQWGVGAAAAAHALVSIVTSLAVMAFSLTKANDTTPEVFPTSAAE